MTFIASLIEILPLSLAPDVDIESQENQKVSLANHHYTYTIEELGYKGWHKDEHLYDQLCIIMKIFSRHWQVFSGSAVGRYSLWHYNLLFQLMNYSQFSLNVCMQEFLLLVDVELSSGVVF